MSYLLIGNPTHMHPTPNKKKMTKCPTDSLGSTNKSTSFANRECKIAFINSCQFLKPIILLSVNTSCLPLYVIKMEAF